MNFYVDPSRLEEGQEIGRGAFGLVLKGKYTTPTGETLEVSGELKCLRRSGCAHHLSNTWIDRMRDLASLASGRWPTPTVPLPLGTRCAQVAIKQLSSTPKPSPHPEEPVARPSPRVL